MNFLEKFRSVHTLIFDIDGVMTSGELFLDQYGHLFRTMNVRDGYAMKKAAEKGFRVGIISGGLTPGAEGRFESLGIKEIHLGVRDKRAALEELLGRHQLDPKGVLFMGDDLPDLEAMQIVGLPCCPRDAVDEIRDLSIYVSPKEGGQGCVRDVIEKVMKLQGSWPGYPNVTPPS